MKGNPNDRNGAPQRRRWMAAVLGTLTRTVTSWRREKSQLLRAPAPSPGSLIREGGCTLYSPSSQRVSPMEFHLHPPGSPSQKPRGLQTSHTSPPPHTTTDQTASNSSLIFSGPLHSPTSTGLPGKSRSVSVLFHFALLSGNSVQHQVCRAGRTAAASSSCLSAVTRDIVLEFTSWMATALPNIRWTSQEGAGAGAEG